MTEPDAPGVVARLHGAATLKLPARDGRVALERKQALLLAYLWLEGPTPRGKLAALLWPDAADARARGNLRQRLAVLRQAVGVEVVDDERGVLSLSPRLRVEPAVPTGPALLASFEFDDCEAAAAWLDGQREGRRARQRGELLAQVRAAVQAGGLDEALRLADQLLGLDRESEEAYRIQMEVLYLRGDTAAAIAVWDRCKIMLRQLYGVAPSATTRALGETILGAAAEAPRRPAVAADAIPITILRPPRLIGRDVQVASLLAAWHAGRTLCISGEAGVGKSRLLAELATAIGPCVVASARPGDAAMPHASLGRLLLAAIDRFEPPLDGDDARQAARLVPRLAGLVAGASPAPVQTDYERRQCLRGVAGLLALCVERGCRALLVDDLQFADGASVEALIDMAEAVASATDAGAPLRFVFATRGDELGERSAALLAGLDHDGRFSRIELRPLGETDVGALVASLAIPDVDAATLADVLWRQVGGNPAFVLESVKLLLALGPNAAADQIALPPDVVAVIERRIGLLSAQARHLAQLAAIAGESYSVPLAAAALACTPLALSEPLRELELRQVLYGRRFVHDVIAVAVGRTIAQSVAEFMHRFVADYLEQHDGDAAPIASHWQAGGDDLRAGAAYRRAAALAANASRPIEQSELIDAAAACFERAGALDDLFDTLEDRLAVTTAPDYPTMRIRAMTRMESLARSDAQRLRAVLCRHGFDSDNGHTRAINVGLAAIDEALALGLAPIAFELARSTAWQLAMRGDEAAALRVLESQRPWVESGAAAGARVDFHWTLSAVLGFVDRLGEAIAEGRAAVAELRPTGATAKLLPILSNLGLILFWRGELADAKAALLEAVQWRDRMHGRGSALVIDLHLAAVLHDSGEYVAAHGTLSSTLDDLRAQADGGGARTDLVFAENGLALLWLSLGQPARALAAMVTDDAGIAVRFRGRRQTLRLRAARFQGRAAPELVASAEQLIATIDSPFLRALLELELACTQPPATMRALCERLLGERSVRERPGLALHVAARAGEAALALGDVDAAFAHIERVRALGVGVTPYDIDRAEVARIVASVLRAAGQADAATDVLAAAATWLQGVAATLADDSRRNFLQRHPANRQVLEQAAATA